MRILSSHRVLLLCLMTGGLLRARTEKPVQFNPDLPPGSSCLINAGTLHPAQYSVGMKEVELRSAKISTMSQKKLDSYLKDHVVPVAIGPGGVPYILDHHHLARSILKAAVSPMLYAEIKANWAGLPEAQFWDEMKKHNWVYLRDENGKGPLEPSALPATVLAMHNDPYRSLAWAVREANGIAKTEAPFYEFTWADYFRTRIPVDRIAKDFALATSDALKLCHLPEASHLPGFVEK